MTNTSLLEKYIQESGIKRGKLAQELGLTFAGFKKKTSGRSEFKASEIQALCKLLGIKSKRVMDEIFFA